MSRRVAAGVVVLVLWAGVVGWHVRREYFVPELERVAEATLGLAPGTNYFALESGGETIGTGSSQLDTLPDGFRLSDLMIVELEGAGSVVLDSEVVLTRALRVRSFAYRLEAGGVSFEAAGAVEGDSLVRVETADDEFVVRVDEPPIPAAAVPLLLAHTGEMQVGRRLRVPVFDPSSLSARPVEVQVLEVGTFAVSDSAVFDPGTERWRPGPEREVAAWRIRESFAGITAESWIDADGRVLRATSPMGFTLRRASFELARQARDDRAREPDTP